MPIQKITPFLWLDNQVEEAVKYYVSVFPNSKIIDLNPMMATFELEGQRFMALNGGPQFKFTEAISFFVSCETQEEVDYFWTRLIENDGKESRCGWLKDKFGLSWQIIPTALGKLLRDPDPVKSQSVMQAMLQMNKIEIDKLQLAYDGK